VQGACKCYLANLLQQMDVLNSIFMSPACQIRRVRETETKMSLNNSGTRNGCCKDRNGHYVTWQALWNNEWTCLRTQDRSNYFNNLMSSSPRLYLVVHNIEGPEPQWSAVVFKRPQLLILFRGIFCQNLMFSLLLLLLLLLLSVKCKVVYTLVNKRFFSTA
jgi:hypothetical protein